MRVLSPEDFKKCKPGTVFAYGPKWAFSDMMILSEVIQGAGYWGFWAVSPMWVDSEDCGEAIDRLSEMVTSGASYPLDTDSSKFMSYDGDAMDVFIVMDRSDWGQLSQLVAFD